MITIDEFESELDSVIWNAQANMVPTDIILSELRRAEEYACRYAGFSSPPTRRDSLENREQEDVYYAVLDGYEQAEKDLALTWQDIAKIITIYEQELDERIINRYGDVKNLQPYCERILEKFNELKQKK